MPFEATITSIHQMTPQVKQFIIEADEPFEFEPGQHTTVQFEQDDPDEDEDQEVVRPYTATNTPGNTAITLAIKRYDDGTASV
uniref:FAD-binding oxidoreductase n=1 Tax=Halalkalicoccus subterraneus TaxID=2675002 RepID=UPI001FE28197